MDKHILLKAFNQVNMNVVDYCINLMPDNIELATMKNALIGLIATTPELNIITFRECTLKKYRPYIEKRDISFFVEKKYDDHVEDIGISKLVYEKMDCLRIPIGNMNKEQKETILDFMQKMIKLCDMYSNQA